MRLYIHIPFCASKCGYCAFTSFVGEEANFESYIEALCVDLEQSLKAKYYHLNSIFIGGGTPNLLDSKFYQKIFTLIEQYAHIEQDCEISLEANVNLLNKQWCKDLRALGANRLSVGVQSFYEPKLAFLERDHSVKDIAYRMESAYNAGFSNLSCDLIITPLDTRTILESELINALKLPIQHLSVYALSIDEGSRFAAKKDINEKMNENNEEELSFFARDLLEARGFRQYEVSNYAKNHNGKNCTNECAHNIGYWQGEEYVGAGLGAVGRIGQARLRAYTHFKQYLQNPTGRYVEHLESTHLRTEAIMLGLRCVRGFDIAFLGKNAQELIALLIQGEKCHIKKAQEKTFLCANELFLGDEIALWILYRL